MPSTRAPFQNSSTRGALMTLPTKAAPPFPATIPPATPMSELMKPDRPVAAKPPQREREEQCPPWFRVEAIDDDRHEEVGHHSGEGEARAHEHVIKVVARPAARLLEQWHQREEEEQQAHPCEQQEEVDDGAEDLAAPVLGHAQFGLHGGCCDHTGILMMGQATREGSQLRLAFAAKFSPTRRPRYDRSANLAAGRRHGPARSNTEVRL